mgnify:CR=1 FL=1
MKTLVSMLVVLCCLATLFFMPAAFSDTPEPENPRVKQGLRCCADKERACYNIHADRRQCAVAYEACVENCRSEGNAVAEWGDCWSASRP